MYLIYITVESCKIIGLTRISLGTYKSEKDAEDAIYSYNYGIVVDFDIIKL